MSFKDDLDNVSGGRISNDRLYDLTKEAALAYAKQLGDELGEVYLDKWAKCQIEKITRECDKTKADYKVWNKDEKFNVSGGMPNPASVHTEEEFLTPGKPDGAEWWFDSNCQGAKACGTLEEAIKFADKYKVDHMRIEEIWRRHHK